MKMKKVNNTHELTSELVLAYLIDDIKIIMSQKDSNNINMLIYYDTNSIDVSTVRTLKEAFDFVLHQFYFTPNEVFCIDSDIDLSRNYSFEEFNKIMEQAVFERFPTFPQPIREQAYYYWYYRFGDYYDRTKRRIITEVDKRLLKKLRSSLIMSNEQAH